MQHTLTHWVAQAGWMQALVAGILLGIGFVFPAFWFLCIFSLMYIVHVIYSNVSIKKITLLFTCIWFIKSILSISWFWSAYPISWIEGINASIQIMLISAYWLSSGMWLASGGAFFGLVSIWLVRHSKLPRNISILMLPVLWLGAELFSAFIFSLCTAGPGSFLQTYFSFGMVGYLLGVTSIGVWLAILGGVYGLTIILLALAVFGYWLTIRVSKKLSIIMGVLLYSIFSFTTITPNIESQTPITVIAVDTQFNAEFISTIEGLEFKATTLAHAVDTAVKNKPNVIVLPEDSRYLSSQFNSLYPNQAMSMFQFTHGNTNTTLIDSGRYTTEAGMTVLRANIFDGVSKKLWQIDKQYLVPQGEYVPLVYSTALRLLGYGFVVDAVAIDSAYRPGPLTQTSELPNYIPGVLFCFESVRSQAVRVLSETRDSIPFIAHPISHAWFHSPLILWQQLHVMLQLQSRYSGLPIVSAGNMATGKLYLPNGIIDSGEIIESGDKYILRKFQF